mmetsp:Transcript_26004/g.36663  ORF Transcript_26004/g.36663 Transcript_26004/m.36663 type:complete len:168 (-) Transcript_26004:3127-3630(-)
MARLIYALLLIIAAVSVCGLSQKANTRRKFINEVPALVGSSVAMGWFVNLEQHEVNCKCETCTSTSSQFQHGVNCQCTRCFSYGPPMASAYERDVGGTERSAETAAFNIQAKKTNARLEKDGFKLDTKEEEQARLSDAMASFSYESSTSGKKQNSRGNRNRAAEQKK